MFELCALKTCGLVLKDSCLHLGGLVLKQDVVPCIIDSFPAFQVFFFLFCFVMEILDYTCRCQVCLEQLHQND